MEVAQFRLLESWGIRPDLLAGHSIGELAAAHVAGVLSLENAALLVAARGRLMQQLPAEGAMISVQATEDEVRPLLAGREAQVGLAAVNGPTSLVVSGDEDAVLEVAAALARPPGHKTKRLRVSHAFHSPLMTPMLAEFGRLAHVLSYRPPTIPIVSTVTGRPVLSGELCDPEYWVRHVRDSVRFADAVRAMADEGVGTFLELGPAGVLSAMGPACLAEDADAVFAPLLRADQDEETEVVSAVARAHVRGVPVDWTAFFAVRGARQVALPTYPFQRRRFWMESGGGSADATGFGQLAAGHPLVGAVVGLAGGDGVVLTGRARRDRPGPRPPVESGVDTHAGAGGLGYDVAVLAAIISFSRWRCAAPCPVWTVTPTWAGLCAAIDAGAPVPALVFAGLGAGAIVAADVALAARSAAHQALALVQALARRRAARRGPAGGGHLRGGRRGPGRRRAGPGVRPGVGFASVCDGASRPVRAAGCGRCGLVVRRAGRRRGFGGEPQLAIRDGVARCAPVGPAGP